MIVLTFFQASIYFIAFDITIVSVFWVTAITLIDENSIKSSKRLNYIKDTKEISDKRRKSPLIFSRFYLYLFQFVFRRVKI